VFHISICGGLELCLGLISPPIPLVAMDWSISCSRIRR